MAGYTNNNNTYKPPLPLNTIFFFGSSPSATFANNIQALNTPPSLRNTIGITINPTVKIKKLKNRASLGGNSAGSYKRRAQNSTME